MKEGILKAFKAYTLHIDLIVYKLKIVINLEKGGLDNSEKLFLVRAFWFNDIVESVEV